MVVRWSGWSRWPGWPGLSRWAGDPVGLSGASCPGGVCDPGGQVSWGG